MRAVFPVLTLACVLAVGIGAPVASSPGWVSPAAGSAVKMPADGVTCSLSEGEANILRICEAVERVFESAPGIWPGYSLSRQPFIVYVPDRWVLAFNVQEAEGFGATPDGWPDLGCHMVYRPGSYAGLAGQLAFDVPVGDTVAVAVGLPETMPESLENPELYAFAFIVHEAFHQYQHASFGEIPWSREELYPIEDVGNTALASLEVRILRVAVRAGVERREKDVRRALAEFAVVRRHRWDIASDFVREHEQALELKEGTAHYVELAGVEALGRLEYTSGVDGSVSPLPAQARGATAGALLSEEFDERFPGDVVGPGDMARNRVYAVAAAECFLLDVLGVDWRASAEAAGPRFTYVGLLDSTAGEEPAPALTEIKRRHGYADLQSVAERLIAERLELYREELAAFESQEGCRVEIRLPAGNLTRSRSGRAVRWVVNEGARTFSSHFDVYTLRGKGLSLDIRDAGVVEDTDWATGQRCVAAFTTERPGVVTDGVPLGRDVTGPVDFGSIEIDCSTVILDATWPGTISLSPDSVSVRLDRR